MQSPALFFVRCFLLRSIYFVAIDRTPVTTIARKAKMRFSLFSAAVEATAAGPFHGSYCCARFEIFSLFAKLVARAAHRVN